MGYIYVVFAKTVVFGENLRAFEGSYWNLLEVLKKNQNINIFEKLSLLLY